MEHIPSAMNRQRLCTAPQHHLQPCPYSARMNTYHDSARTAGANTLSAEACHSQRIREARTRRE